MEEKEDTFAEETDPSDKKPKIPVFGNRVSSTSEMNGSTNRSFSNTSFPFSNSSSPTEMDPQSSDMEIQIYSNSSSSGYSDSFTSESMQMKLREDVVDGKDNCIPLTNGPITLSLMEAKLWYKFLEVGTEMIINRTGRRMFPYVEFSLRGVDPVGLYDVIFDIIPASNKCFKFLNNKWVPIGKKEHEFKTQPFKHPDSPRTGSEWMTRKISFEKVKLSNRPGSKSGIFTLHTQQKYLVRISLVKYEKGDEVPVVEYPIQATTFVAVTAYNNREVADLKINSNPYSKAFRYPVKRMKIQSFIPNQERTHATKNGAKKKSVIANIQNYQKVLQQNLLIDVSPINKKAKTSYVSSETKNEKGIQTDISMADIQSWYKFLASPLAMSFFEMNVPLPIFPHVNGNICEQESYNGYNGNNGAFLRRRFLVPPSATSSSSDNQNDEEMQNKIIKRDIAREERKMQHDARLETSDIKDDVQKHIGRERTTEERLEQYKSRMESPLAMSFFEMNVPLPIFPHVNGNICEQESYNGYNGNDGAFLRRRFLVPPSATSSSSDNQNDEEMQNKIIKRDIAREERKMQHDARLETSDIKDDVQKHIGRERTTEERLEQYKSRMEKHCNKHSDHSGAFLPRRFLIPAETISSSDNQKEEEMQNKNNSRERTTREERLEEYNARIEMWKRDKD